MQPSPAENLSPWRWFALALLTTACVFAAVFPTLRMTEFVGGNENLVVETALEMRRGGPWLVPNMNGEPRIAKPPLVAWITAASLRAGTLEQIGSTDPNVRRHAYDDLLVQVRLNGLLAGCLTMLVAFELGRVLMDARVGLLACAMVGTTYLMQRYMRQATTDIHLTLWVAMANTGFAHAIFRRNSCGIVVGLVCSAVAFLCKGPVGIVETIAPCAAFLIGESVSRRVAKNAPPTPRRLTDLPLLAWFIGMALFIAIASPWFIHVWRTVPNVFARWQSEVTRVGATDLRPDSPAMYLLLLPLTAPWAVMGLVGLVSVFRKQTSTRSMVFALLLSIVPLAIMAFFKDRKDRYMLPMIVPAGVICAQGAILLMREPVARLRRFVAGAHFGVLLLMTCGLTLAGAMTRSGLVQKGTGAPWFSPQLAGWIVVLFVALIGLGIVFYRRWNAAIFIVTVVAMLILQVIFNLGYGESDSGRSPLRPLAELIWQRYPTARVIDFNPDSVRTDEDLAIYLNRPVTREDPQSLSPTTQPIILIVRQPGASQPPAPAGWTAIGKVKERKNWWWAFVRPQQT